MDSNRISYTDRRILNDLDKTTPEQRQYHEHEARQEAARIVDKHRSSPVYLKVLSQALSELANAAYQKHQEKQNSSPEAQAREAMKRELLEELRQKPELMEQDFFTGRNSNG